MPLACTGRGLAEAAWHGAWGLAQPVGMRGHAGCEAAQHVHPGAPVVLDWTPTTPGRQHWHGVDLDAAQFCLIVCGNVICHSLTRLALTRSNKTVEPVEHTSLAMLGCGLLGGSVEGQRLQGMQQPVWEGLEGVRVDGSCRAAIVVSDTTRRTATACTPASEQCRQGQRSVSSPHHHAA